MKQIFRLIAAGVTLISVGGLAEAGVLATAAWADDTTQPEAQTRSFTFVVEPDEASLVFEPELPGPGYLTLSAPTVDLPIGTPTAQLVYSDGRRTGTGTTRIAIDEDVRVEISGVVPGEAGTVNLVWYPELDITEPNSDPLLAWPIESSSAVETVLFPAGDVDVFSIELDRPSIIRIDSEDQPAPLTFSYVAEDGRRLGSGPRVQLEAGTVFIEARYADGNFQSPLPVRIRMFVTHLPFVPTDGSELPVEPPLEAGDTVYLPANGSSTAIRTLKVNEAGLYSVEVSNNNNPVLALFAKSEDERRVTDFQSMLLNKGEYQLELSRLQNTDKPRFLSIYRADIKDATEPNDFMSDAYEMKIGEPTEFWFERVSTTDFFTLTPRKDGDLYLNLTPSAKPCPAPRAFTYLQDENMTRTEIVGPVVFEKVKQRFGPLSVTRGVPVTLELTCFNGFQDYGYTAELNLLDPDTSLAPEKGAPVYLVGVELSPQSRSALQAASDSAGISFIDAADAESLSEEIDEAVQASQQNVIGPMPWRLVLLAIVIALGAAFWLWLSYFRKKEKRVESTEPKSE